MECGASIANALYMFVSLGCVAAMIWINRDTKRIRAQAEARLDEATQLHLETAANLEREGGYILARTPASLVKH